MHIVGIADLYVARANASCALAGWPSDQYAASGPVEAARGGATFISDDSAAPLGLATGVRLRRDILSGERLSWDDVDIDEASLAVRVRREMEAGFS
jgi:predicted homoserine dehydrogenase-like protein